MPCGQWCRIDVRWRIGIGARRFPDAVTSFSLLVLCVGAVVVLFAVGVSVFAMSWSSSAHRSDASWVSVSSSMFHIGSLLSGILVVFCPWVGSVACMFCLSSLLLRLSLTLKVVGLRRAAQVHRICSEDDLLWD